MKPSKQQQDIVEAALTGSNLSVKALAGAAKTTTSGMVLEALNTEALYVCFNKSIAQEASAKFKDLAECRTMHSLAYGAIINKKNRKKLAPFLDRDFVGTLVDGREKVLQVHDIIEQFCISSNYTLSSFLEDRDIPEDIETASREYWKAICDDESPAKMSHNCYLKRFHLSKPTLPYKLIVVDEFQDLNPVTWEIIHRQSCQKIVVGDPYQSIYAFNGAINAFDRIDDSFKEMYLTTSYRFSEEIAQTALKILRFSGYEGELNTQTSLDNKIEDRAILARTNLDLFRTALANVEDGKTIHIIGGFKDLYSLLWGCLSLRKGDLKKVYNQSLKRFNSWDELVEEAETSPELSKLVSIVRWAENLPSCIKRLQAAEVEREEADIVLSTCHKAKGLEFDRVTMAEGFIPSGDNFVDLTREEQLAQLKEDQTLNLCYIGATRAKKELVLPLDLIEFFAL